MTLSIDHEGIHTILVYIMQDFMQYLHQTGLSRPQIHALLHIFHAGECPISEISTLTGSSAAAASQLVERLVQQGLIQRSEDPNNRRIKKLHLTDRGLKLIDEGVNSNRFLVDLMASLPAHQRDTVHTAFGYLAQASHRLQSSHEQKVKHDAQIS